VFVDANFFLLLVVSVCVVALLKSQLIMAQQLDNYVECELWRVSTLNEILFFVGQARKCLTAGPAGAIESERARERAIRAIRGFCRLAEFEGPIFPFFRAKKTGALREPSARHPGVDQLCRERGSSSRVWRRHQGDRMSLLKKSPKM
jgi:hypothetical protein